MTVAWLDVVGLTSTTDLCVAVRSLTAGIGLEKGPAETPEAAPSRKTRILDCSTHD
jgi:hypothetical protein